MRHEPDEIPQIVAGPIPGSKAVAPPSVPFVAVYVIASLDDIGELLVGERRFVCNSVGANRWLQIGTDWRLRNELPVDAKSPESPEALQHLASRTNAETAGAVET